MVRTLKRTDAGSPLLTPEVATVQPNGGSRRVESPIEPIPPPGKAAATTGAIGTILLSTAPVTLSVAAGVMVVLYAVQLDPASAVVPNWYGEWPLTTDSDYCAFVRESSKELLLHGFLHLRQPSLIARDARS